MVDRDVLTPRDSAPSSGRLARSSMAQATSMNESPSWIAFSSASAIDAKP